MLPTIIVFFVGLPISCSQNKSISRVPCVPPPIPLSSRAECISAYLYDTQGTVLSGMSKAFLTEVQSSPSRMKLLTRSVLTYVTEAYFIIVGCLICGCGFEMWGDFHNAATGGFVLYKA